MHNVLFFANHKTSVRTMVPLGRYFKGHDDLNPILFLLLTDRNRDFNLEEIDYDYVIGNQAPKGKSETPKKSSPISKKTWRVLSPGARNDITYAAWPLPQLIYVRQLRQAFTRAQGSIRPLSSRRAGTSR